MNLGPLVSVIIPTYNRANYIALAVASVLNQTYRNVELYIIDDGSSDNTIDVLSEYLNDPRVTYYKQANAGQGAATNRGIAFAKGEYIAFLDSDDQWIPQKLELQVKAAQKKKDIAVFYSPCCCVDENNKITGNRECPLYEGRVTNYLFIKNFIPFGTTFVRKECFDELGGFDDDLVTGLDYDLWLRFSTRYLFGYVTTPTLLYRIWEGQVTSDPIVMYENGIRIMERFLKHFPQSVDNGAQKEGWAHTYTGFGSCSRGVEGRRMEALKLYLMALRFKFGYLPAWKGLVATLLGR